MTLSIVTVPLQTDRRDTDPQEKPCGDGIDVATKAKNIWSLQELEEWMDGWMNGWVG